MGYTAIETTMIRKVIKNEGRGKNFSWWYDDAQTNLVIAYTADVTLEEGHKYSIKEITNMIKENKIIVLGEKDLDLQFEEIIADNKEEYYNFEKCKIGNIFSSESKFYSQAIKFLRERFTIKKILTDLELFIIDFQEELEEIVNSSDMDLNLCLEELNKLGLMNEISTTFNKYQEMSKKYLKKK